ncbi:hypothetical protein CYMTET_54817 [Cymbomonas tetramitiformis]|uniref:Uncharacterized protein n=1 Tax=Cymbomonas tetramitiformis TaxID=36881 RepID=A0AAE0BE53_9CHLO|nr:hypothetical protein CYMTET_54817 [Cymbomonas tetramitiformis]
MASTGRRSLGEALRSARAASASGTPAASVTVILARRGPLPLGKAFALLARQHECADRLDYACNYGEELVKLLRSHGFKPHRGYTLDGSDAKTDFAILLSNLHHVLSHISHFEYDKIFDLEHEYLVEYHWALNELVFIIFKGVLQSTTLALYQESARVHPRDGSCALQRSLRFHGEATTDPDTFQISRAKLSRFYMNLIDDAAAIEL